MKVNDAHYGGFMTSKNVLTGAPIRYTYREKSELPVLNGWTIYSALDDDDYVGNPSNFTIVGATTISQVAPVLLELFDAPYGTDLFWLYEEDVHVGFCDLVKDKETTIKKILKARP